MVTMAEAAPLRSPESKEHRQRYRMETDTASGLPTCRAGRLEKLTLVRWVGGELFVAMLEVERLGGVEDSYLPVVFCYRSSSGAPVSQLSERPKLQLFLSHFTLIIFEEATCISSDLIRPSPTATVNSSVCPVLHESEWCTRDLFEIPPDVRINEP